MKIGDKRGVPRTKEDMEEALESGYVIKAFRDVDATVEMMLDHVDLKLDWYIPSENAFKFVNFIRMCLGEEPENLNSINHYFFVDCLFREDCVAPYFKVRNIKYKQTGNHKTAILGTREFSKSVILGYLILFMATEGEMPSFGKVNFGMYVSDAMDKNVKRNMELLETLYLGSKFLKSKFEYAKFTDKYVEFIRKPTTKRELEIYSNHIKSGGDIKEVPQRWKRKFKLQGLGSSGGRGSGSGVERPQFAIYDDLVANEVDAYSQAYLDAIDSTINSDVGRSLSGNGHFQIIIGTAYHVEDPVYKRLEKGGWLPLVFPKAEEAPHSGIYDANGDTIVPPMTKERFVSVWEDRHTYENQKAEYLDAEDAYRKGSSKELKSINQEYYIRVTSNHERLIQDQHLVWTDMTEVIKNANSYNWYLTTDLTTSANIDSNLSSQILWAVDWEENWYIYELVGRKNEVNVQYSNILRMMNIPIKNKGKWCDVGIEIDGQQSLHVIALDGYAEKRGVYISYAKQAVIGNKKATWTGIRSKGSGDKLWRLKLVAPRFHEKQVFLNRKIKNTEDYIELNEELKMTTHNEIKSKYDDILDCEIAGTQICVGNGKTVSIEDIKDCDLVLTVDCHNSIEKQDVLTYRKASDAIMIGVKDVSEYVLSNGDIVTCTDNHLFMTTDGYVFACELTENHKIVRSNRWKNMDTNGLKTTKDTGLAQQKSMEDKDLCINTLTGSILGYGVVTEWLCIIMTKIKRTMSLKTLDLLQFLNIGKFIKMTYHIGQKVRKELSFIKIDIRMTRIIHLKDYIVKYVSNVVQNMKHSMKQEKLVQENAQQNYITREQQSIKIEKNTIQNQDPAKNVEINLNQTPSIQNIVQKNVEESIGRRIKNSIISLARIVVKSFQVKKVVQNTARKNAEEEMLTNTQYHGLAKEKDVVVLSTLRMQKEDKSIVQKIVNLKIDEKVEENVRNNIDSFDTIKLINVRNRRREKVYGFEVKGTNNYLSGSGIVMHNCISQMALIDIEYPPKPLVDIRYNKKARAIEKIFDDSMFGPMDHYASDDNELSRYL